MKKLVSIMLVLIMMLAMPFPVIAGTGNETPDITISEPVMGKAMNFNIQSVSELIYDNAEVIWIAEKIRKDTGNHASTNYYNSDKAGTFKYDEYSSGVDYYCNYSVEITLKKNNVQDYYNGVTAININGHPAQIDTGNYTDGPVYSFVTVTYDFGIAERTSIDEVYLTGYKPLRIGMEQIEIVPDSENRHYTCWGGYHYWNTGGAQMATGFEEGKSYWLRIRINPDDDYDFAGLDISDVHVICSDGSELSTEGATINFDIEGGRGALIDFPSETLQAIVLDLKCTVPEPTAGEVPAVAAAVPENSDYSCTGVDWYVSDYDWFNVAEKMAAGQKFELGRYYFAKPKFEYSEEDYDRTTLEINGEECTDGYYSFGLLKEKITAKANFATPVLGVDVPLEAAVPSGAVYKCPLVWYELDTNDPKTWNVRQMAAGEKFRLGYYYATIPQFQFNDSGDEIKYHVTEYRINDQVLTEELLLYGPVQKLTQSINSKSSYSIVYGSSLTLKPGAATKVTYKSSNKKVATVSSKGVIKATGIGTVKITVSAAESSMYKKSTRTITVKCVPKKATISSLTPKTKSLTVKMKTTPSKLKGSYYQVSYRVKGTSKWKTVTTGKQSLTIKKLKKGKVYQVKVRAFKKVSGKTYYGAWSKTKLSKKIK